MADTYQRRAQEMHGDCAIPPPAGWTLAPEEDQPNVLGGRTYLPPTQVPFDGVSVYLFRVGDESYACVERNGKNASMTVANWALWPTGIRFWEFTTIRARTDRGQWTAEFPVWTPDKARIRALTSPEGPSSGPGS